MSGPRPVIAPRGTELSCANWQIEAPYRMLQNNLDPDVAERPDDLVVYGGTGRAARSWDAYDAMLRTMQTMKPDETMLVQSGKPVGVFRTHEWAPRVLLANSNLVGEWATWRRTRPNCVLRDLFRRTPLNRLGARQLLGRGCFATFDTEPRSASWHKTIRFRVEQLLGEVRT